MTRVPSGESRPLADPTYRRLFAAQVVSLTGTGLTSVALALLAYDLAGKDAGRVVGIALALKMIAYVVVAPVLAGVTYRLPRRALLIGLDLGRVAVIVLMPFVTAVWQVYVLIFVLNALAAGFTPAFQAVIPDVLENEEAYTRALSLSRLAYELENLASPAVAAALLTIVSYDALFALDGVTFLVSAALVASVTLPGRGTTAALRTVDRITRGVRRYVTLPRLRGLLALNLAAAAASAMVIVNTVVYVRDDLGRGNTAVAWALAASGAGAMAAALLSPRLLARWGDRRAMLAGGAVLPIGLAFAAVTPSFGVLLGLWALLGVGLALVQTPAGNVVQRSVADDDGPELFAAQFALSHACWLITYPMAGLIGAARGIGAASGTLAVVAALAAVAAATLWTQP